MKERIRVIILALPKQKLYNPLINLFIVTSAKTIKIYIENSIGYMKNQGDLWNSVFKIKEKE